MLRTTALLRVLLICLLVLLNTSQAKMASAEFNASIGDGPADVSVTAVNQFLTIQAPRSTFKIYLPLITRPVPGIEAGKFNVAVVLVGPHDDGGWNQAHYDSLVYIEKNVPNTHVAYVENVPEGPRPSRSSTRWLATAST